MIKSPKLTRAMIAIKAILDEENIAGIVVLHEPGFAEFWVKVNPSYSCCRIENGAYKVNAQLHEDFGGDREAMERRVSDTSDMLNTLVTTAARCTIPLGEITRVLNRATDQEDPAANN